MTAALLCLLVVFPLGSITRSIGRAMREEDEARNIIRLTAPWPEPRQRLAYPEPVTPMDLPARDATFTYHGPSRVRVHIGRHRIGEAPGTVTQQARWNSDTGQFWAIVEFNAALDEPCSHCAAPEDGERAHVGCPGCACPCGAVPPLPVGVEGHAIAGRTR